MQKLVLSLIVVVVLCVLVFFYTATYSVGQAQKAIKFRLGEIVSTDVAPGLHLQWPIINNVRTFDARIHTLDEEPQRFMTVEKKNVIVDSFLKWRIDNVGKYYTTVGGDPERTNLRLSEILKNGLRNEFGKRTINEVVSGDRAQIMNILQRETSQAAKSLGVEVVDVRIKRVDLPEDVSDSVYQRMSAERERAARRFRAEGKEAAERIRAEADRRRQVILADAHRDAEKIRGQGDAQAAAIYASAYSRHPDFYSFYRSLIAYGNVFDSKDDLFVLSPDSTFFRYFDPEKKKP
ncbi:MAG TPA: protease modulator HflC [Nitrococcus sp.]|nr:protease modulator HflC [Nitrococcus sp.]